MANKATVTAKTGPGIQNTAIVINDLTGIKFDFGANTFTVDADGRSDAYSLEGVTAITCTVSGSSFTWVVS